MIIRNRVGLEQVERVVNEEGYLHREDGPAKTTYFPDGKSVRVEEWHLNGERHRNDGPAVIVYHKKGVLANERWFVNGQAHRDDGPAVINYSQEGQATYFGWFLDGEKHREEGPASILLNNDGTTKATEFWFRGKFVNPQPANMAEYEDMLPMLHLEHIMRS